MTVNVLHVNILVLFVRHFNSNLIQLLLIDNKLYFNNKNKKP